MMMQQLRKELQKKLPQIELLQSLQLPKEFIEKSNVEAARLPVFLPPALI